MKYRPEIDGLRALAVLPVVFFHAGFPAFSGGYIGVDVFFVISGYLITTILLTEAREGRISLLRFYDRRARRILPALFVVILACIPVAWVTMTPSQMQDFSLSIMSVLFFVSNVFFWRQDDYFGARAEEMPLLHTWSLSVEEQFYVLFPLLMILALTVIRRHITLLIALLTLVSFIIALWAQADPEISDSAVFYLLPARAWELGIGALCACYLSNHSRINNDWLAGLGVVMIISAAVLFDKGTPTPSAYTLIPTLGAALIILCSAKGGNTYSILSLQPFVAIGLISYALYLWHQPLFAFARISVYGHPDPWEMAFLIILSLALAYITWRFVEGPARDVTLLSRRVVFFALAGAFLGLLFASSIERNFQLHASMMFSDPIYGSVEAPQRDPSWLTCMSRKDELWKREDVCQYGQGEETIAILGNSHGGGFAVSLAEQLHDRNFTVADYTISTCSFVFGAPVDQQTSSCQSWFAAASEDILSRSDIETIVMSFRLENSSPENFQSLQAFAERAMASGKRIIVVDQAPTLIEDIEYYVYNRLDQSLNSAARPLREWQVIYYSAARALSDLPANVLILDISDIFCDLEMCYAVRNGVPLYFDDDHMSFQAARLVMERLANAIISENATADGWR